MHSPINSSSSTRAASLALPNNVIVNFLEDSHQQSGQFAHQQHFANAPHQPHFKLAPPSASSINIRRHSSHHCQIIDKVSEEQLRLQTLPVLPSAPSTKQLIARQAAAEPQPPPVPKRNFKKSPGQLASPNLMFDPVPEASPTVVAPVDFRRKQTRKIVQANCELGTARYGSVCGAQSSDDDLLNMDSPVFVEHAAQQQRAGSNASAGTNPFLARSSNRSSGDSTKSQATIDTGYMTEPPGDRIFFGDSVDVYRGRFSSVDTQSSIDSGCTDVTKCMSPPSSCGLPPTPSAPPLTGGSMAPAVPKRRQKSFPRIPPPASRGNGPPVPPARTGLDSPRMLQNNKGNAGSGSAAGFAHELYSKPAAIVRKLRHHPTQRQDSTLSSDSFAASYSPGFSNRSMEQPLLPQRATAAQRAGMAAVHKGGGGGGGGTMRHASLRQNSNHSSDSVSVTSSPGYNTQLIESPLIAHTDKLHTSKISASFMVWHV